MLLVVSSSLSGQHTLAQVKGLLRATNTGELPSWGQQQMWNSHLSSVRKRLMWFVELSSEMKARMFSRKTCSRAEHEPAATHTRALTIYNERDTHLQLHTFGLWS